MCIMYLLALKLFIFVLKAELVVAILLTRVFVPLSFIHSTTLTFLSLLPYRPYEDLCFGSRKRHGREEESEREREFFYYSSVKRFSFFSLTGILLLTQYFPHFFHFSSFFLQPSPFLCVRLLCAVIWLEEKEKRERIFLWSLKSPLDDRLFLYRMTQKSLLINLLTSWGRKTYICHEFIYFSRYFWNIPPYEGEDTRRTLVRWSNILQLWMFFSHIQIIFYAWSKQKILSFLKIKVRLKRIERI